MFLFPQKDSLEEENDQNLSERTEHFFIDPEVNIIIIIIINAQINIF